MTGVATTSNLALAAAQTLKAGGVLVSGIPRYKFKNWKSLDEMDTIVRYSIPKDVYFRQLEASERQAERFKGAQA